MHADMQCIRHNWFDQKQTLISKFLVLLKNVSSNHLFLLQIQQLAIDTIHIFQIRYPPLRSSTRCLQNVLISLKVSIVIFSSATTGNSDFHNSIRLLKRRGSMFLVCDSTFFWAITANASFSLCKSISQK